MDNGFGHDAADAWLAAAHHAAALGDVTSIAQTPWATAVSVTSQAGVPVVRVGGEIATGSAAYLDLVLEQELSAEPHALIVDLSNAAFIGVRGIAALLRAAGRAAENSTTLCVVAPFHLGLLRRLGALGVAELFDVHTSVADCGWALNRREPTRNPWTPGRRKDDSHLLLGGEPSSDPSTSAVSELRILVDSTGSVGLLRLAGPLSLRTASSVAVALAKLLVDRGYVVADLSAVRLLWAPALLVFPATLASLGGWPGARLVLLDADRELTEAIRAVRIDRVVPLARGWSDAQALIARRPPVVIRHHELPGGPSSPRRARVLIRSACADWQIEELVSDAAIVAGELVANAVQHARTAIRLSLRIVDTALHIAVRDHRAADDATLQRLRTAPAPGHGLHVVAAICRVHGVTPHSDGKTVWGAIGLDSAERPDW